MRRLCAGFVAVALVAGCGSSDGSTSSTPPLASIDTVAAPPVITDAAPPTGTDAALPTDTGAALPTDTDARMPVSAPSNIVNNYDTATCGDWLVTDATNRRIVAVYFLVKTKREDLTDYTDSLITATTVACKNLPDEITVSKVARLNIKTMESEVGTGN